MEHGVGQRILFAASMVALLALPSLAPSASAQGDLDLDHFKCYSAPGRFGGALIGVQDQFDTTARDARVRPPTLFCNPVQKTTRSDTGAPEVTPIGHRDHHLRFYPIVTGPVPTGGVEIRNQFGDDVLSLTGEGTALAVPTQKLPHDPPVGLDHFKCYGVTGDAVDQRAELQDQFSTERVRVREPYLFCNPTLKRHDNQIFEVHDAEAHLVCYRIVAGPLVRELQTRNQFAAERFRTQRAHSLCVPTEKLGFDIIFDS